MLDKFKKLFQPPAPSDAVGVPDPKDDDHSIRIATCALFLEIANIDNEFSHEERVNIIQMMQDEFGVSEQDANELAFEAAKELKDSIDVWQFTNIVNQNYSEEQKMRVVEMLWKVVYADGKLDAHEDYLLHKLAKMLRLQHKQLIAAKLRVLHDSTD